MGRRKRRRRSKFTKSYIYTKQDEFLVKDEELLQTIHTEIAQKIFSLPKYNFGDWTISMDGIDLFIDPEFGSQAEIHGTSKMPLSERLKIHIKLLKLLRKNWSILKAVKHCKDTLMTR